MTMPQMIEMAERLKPLLAELGWGMDPMKDLVLSHQGISSSGFRFQYPTEIEDYSEQRAVIQVYKDRRVVSQDCRGRFDRRPHPTERGPFTGRGWRQRLLDAVVDEATRLGHLHDEDLPFDLNALPVQKVPRTPDEDLRKFVLGVVDRQILTSEHLRPGDTNILGLVFMPISLGALKPSPEFQEMLPEPPEEPPAKPEVPTLTLPEEPENTVREPRYPEEPAPPVPEDVPQHVLDSVEWGEIDESEVAAYREGEGAFQERLAQWQVQVWQPWKDKVTDLQGKYNADLAVHTSKHNAWVSECAEREAEHAKTRESLRDVLDAWGEADRQYRIDKASHDRIVGRAYQHHFQNLGVIWEWMDKAGPRAINGYPIFFSCRIMHAEDWNRAKRAIIREQERRGTIEI
jgi:hypothetical protein